MPKRVEYRVIATLPPEHGSRTVRCGAATDDEQGAPLTKRSAAALVESLPRAHGASAILQKRLKQTGAAWFTIRAYLADQEGKMRVAPYATGWHLRFR